jgi:hypothetical protein
MLMMHVLLLTASLLGPPLERPTIRPAVSGDGLYRAVIRSQDKRFL